ncbi:hypothetical protein AMJ50_01145 [Parcubacteria bacterium DG_74_3]|nr:MAG: hypothetical protein AMJ50_01145 [Parcubacteria bacterium DG_74_3]
MATHYRTWGFVLKKENIREDDRLLTIFSKDFGKLKILGRAIRKIKSKLRGGSQLFTLSEIEFIQGKTYKTLTDAILVKDFPEIKKNLGKLKIAYQISQALDNLVRGQEPDEKIWKLLNETFKRLNNLQFTVYSLQLIYYYFLWNLLSFLGYTPQLYHCALGQEKLIPAQIFWSSKEGGVICKNCSKKIKETFFKIEPDTIKLLRLILKKDWVTLQRLKIDRGLHQNLREVSKNFYSYILSQIE